MAFVHLTYSLLLLLCISTTVYGDETFALYPPVQAPQSPPPKSHHHHHHCHPPAPPPKKMMAVQGVVYCKSCKFIGVNTLTDAAPLIGATVKLQCNNTQYSLVEQAKTDNNGYFFLMPQQFPAPRPHECKAFLVSSPLANCSVPTNLLGGSVGAILVPAEIPIQPLPFDLFTVGPFAFEPDTKLPCHY